MSLKRDVLARLSRDELVAIADRFELSVKDRRGRDHLIDAVSSSKRATLAELLPSLTRDRLKELCRSLGLDDAGKEKAVLVARLLGKPAASAVPAPAKAKQAGKARPAPTAPPVELATGERLTVDKLEGYLWSAADILRGHEVRAAPSWYPRP